MIVREMVGVWPSTVLELEDEQTRLGAQIVEEWLPPQRPLMVGACFICFRRGYSGSGQTGEPAWCAAVRMRGRRVVEQAVISERAGDSYSPGLLALREGPALEASVRALNQSPEILVVNASGRDHPRRAGLALHLGAVLDIPTIGVTHRPFAGQGDWPPDERGAVSPITFRGDVVAFWLRSRLNARPIVVHSAWRTSPQVALEIVKRCTYRARTPQPLRHARRLARLARAGRIPT
jgi:deoxyribonuclease V